jgi:hypothetical protein
MAVEAVGAANRRVRRIAARRSRPDAATGVEGEGVAKDADGWDLDIATWMSSRMCRIVNHPSMNNLRARLDVDSMNQVRGIHVIDHSSSAVFHREAFRIVE